MANGLLSNYTVAATATGTVDFNLRQVYGNLNIIVASDKNLSVTVYSGVGADDSVQDNTYPIPIVLTGSSVPVYEQVGTSYNIAANVKQQINLTRDNYGDWIKVTFGNKDSSQATISLSGTVR